MEGGSTIPLPVNEGINDVATICKELSEKVETAVVIAAEIVGCSVGMAEPRFPEPSGIRNIEVMETIDVPLNTLLGAVVEGVLIILVGGFVSFLKEEKAYIG